MQCLPQKDARAWKVGRQPDRYCCWTDGGEGMRSPPRSLNGYIQRFPSSVALPCSSIYFFFVIIQADYFKDVFKKRKVDSLPSMRHDWLWKTFSRLFMALLPPTTKFFNTINIIAQCLRSFTKVLESWTAFTQYTFIKNICTMLKIYWICWFKKYSDPTNCLNFTNILISHFNLMDATCSRDGWWDLIIYIINVPSCYNDLSVSLCF